MPPVHSPISVAALMRGMSAEIPGGQALTTVEDRIRDRYGARAILLTDSGTSALTLALGLAARVRRGPVALPAYGCYDLLSACHAAGSDIVFYDVSPETLAPDSDSLAAAVDEGAGVVVVAYLYGLPIDLTRVRSIISGAGALLVEDAAQGTGGLYGGRPLGAHGDLSVLSFARGKGRTGGGGGALLARSEHLSGLVDATAEGLEVGSRLGPWLRAGAQWAFGRPSAYAIPYAIPWLRLGETRYREPQAPAGMSRTAAAILSSNWVAADEEAQRRARNADRYARLLEGEPLQPIPVVPGGRAGFLRYPVLAPGLVPRSAMARFARLGVSSGYPLALPRVVPRPRDRSAGGLEGSTILANRLVTLPVHGLLRPRDLERAAAAAVRVGGAS